jgi:hypothetical protein
MLLRPDGRPWPTGEDSKRPGDLGTLRHKVKEIIRAAGLRDELSFTSFRHGGFTEAADADLSDAEIRAQGRHKSSRVLPRYAKRTMRQAKPNSISGTPLRIPYGNKAGVVTEVVVDILAILTK